MRNRNKRKEAQKADDYFETNKLSRLIRKKIKSMSISIIIK